MVKAVCCNQTACFADGEKLLSLCKALLCSRRLQILAEMLCHCSLAVGKCIYCRHKVILRKIYLNSNFPPWAMCSEQSCEENGGRGCLQGALVLMPLTCRHTRGLSSCTQGGWDQKTEELVELWLHLFSHRQLVAQAQAKVCSVMSTQGKNLSKRCAQKSSRHGACWKHSFGLRARFILPVQW